MVIWKVWSSTRAQSVADNSLRMLAHIHLRFPILASILKLQCLAPCALRVTDSIPAEGKKPGSWKTKNRGQCTP